MSAKNQNAGIGNAPEMTPLVLRTRHHLGRTFMLRRSSIGSIALAAALLMTVPGAQALDESKYPDWSGQWRRVEAGPPRYDHSKPYGRGQQPPLTEEYRLIHEASLAD